MVLASGTQVELRIIEEVTRNTTPSITPGDMDVLRATGRNVNGETDTIETDEVRASGQVSDVRTGSGRVVGSPGFELSLTSYDKILPYVLRNNWGVVTTTSLGVASTTGGDFVRTAGSWITDGLRAGDVVLAAGWTPSTINGQWTVVAVTALLLTVAGTLPNSTGAGTVIVPGQRLDSGTLLKTVTMERAFLDVGEFQVFRGVSFNQMQLSLRPNRMVGGSFSLLGMTSDPWTGASLDSGPTAAPTNSPMSSFSGQLVESTSEILIATSLELTVNDNNALDSVLFSRFSPDVFQGTQRVSGTVTFMLEDRTLINKYQNEVETAIFAKILDPNGSDFISVRLPRVKLLGANIDPPQQGAVPVVMPFLALEDSNATSITIQRSNS